MGLSVELGIGIASHSSGDVSLKPPFLSMHNPKLFQNQNRLVLPLVGFEVVVVEGVEMCIGRTS